MEVEILAMISVSCGAQFEETARRDEFVGGSSGGGGAWAGGSAIPHLRKQLPRPLPSTRGRRGAFLFWPRLRTPRDKRQQQPGLT